MTITSTEPKILKYGNMDSAPPKIRLVQALSVSDKLRMEAENKIIEAITYALDNNMDWASIASTMNAEESEIKTWYEDSIK